MPVEMNKNKWSESSKRSFSYSQSSATHYEDFGYLCVKCGCHCIFSAEDQKIEYEEHKRFIWQMKTLCANCQIQIDVLRNKDKQFQKQWVVNKKTLKTDLQFLCDWISVLEDIPTYGKKSHHDLIATLRKLSCDCVEYNIQK